MRPTQTDPEKCAEKKRRTLGKKKREMEPKIEKRAKVEIFKTTR